MPKPKQMISALTLASLAYLVNKYHRKHSSTVRKMSIYEPYDECIQLSTWKTRISVRRCGSQIHRHFQITNWLNRNLGEENSNDEAVREVLRSYRETTSVSVFSTRFDHGYRGQNRVQPWLERWCPYPSWSSDSYPCRSLEQATASRMFSLSSCTDVRSQSWCCW